MELDGFLEEYLKSEVKVFSEKISGFAPTNIYDRTMTCGKGEEGLKELARVVFEEAEASYRSEERDLEVLTSRFVEREPPKNTIIELSNGKYRVDQTFSKGGGYMIILRKVGEEEVAILACRGTAGKYQATGGFQSVINNLLLEVGSRAVIENWKDILSYLEISGIKFLKICGKSQGGAHAQMLAPLIKTRTSLKVTHVMTYASVGVSDKVRKIFSEVFHNTDTCLEIYYNHGNLNDGEMDFIPYLGGRHVYIEGAKINSLAPEGSLQVSEESIKKQWFFIRIYYLLASFSKPHTRQNTLMHYNKTDAILKDPDPLFELGRKIVANTVHCMTLFYLNPVSYEEFYRSDRVITSSNSCN